MRIIIIGNGKVGYTLAGDLVQEGHDIVIIDNDPTVLRNSAETLDVMCIEGNGSSRNVQLAAGVDEADLLIAVTADDAQNMLCCLVGKKLGAKHTIARVRDPEYTEDAGMLQHELGLSMIINPELTTAQEIARLLHFPAAINIESFAKGRVDLVEFKLVPGDILCGRTIIESIPPRMNILLSVIERNNKLFIPRGDTMLTAGDKVFVVGELPDISAFFQNIGKHNEKVKQCIIGGGGRISYYLAKALAEIGISCTIIEKDEKRCMKLSDVLPDALIILGDTTDREILEEEGLIDTDAYVALTDSDEENIISSLYATYSGVPKVIAKVSRTKYLDMIEKAGIDCVLSPKLLTAEKISTYVRSKSGKKGGTVESLVKIADGRAEAVEFIADRSFPKFNIPITAMKIKKDILITAIVRAGKVIIPHGNDVILEEDRVIIATTEHHSVQDLNSIL